MNEIRKRNCIAGLFLLGVTGAGTFGYYLLGYLAAGKPLWRVGDCFYMTVITLTTVGFGEVIDLAAVPGARLFTVFILLAGLGVAAYFVSSLTAFLVEGELTHVFWRKRMEKQIGKLSGHIILCGTGKVGYHVIQELLRTHTDFVVIDVDDKRILELQQQVGTFPAVAGDATHAAFLRQAGVERAKGVISTLSDDKDNLCVVVTCRQLNPKLHIISACKETEFSTKLELLGAEAVIPNSIGGLRIASKMIRPRVVHYLDLMLRDKNCVVRIEDIVLPEASSLVGKQISTIDFDRYGQLLILAILRAGTMQPIYNPRRAETLAAGDTLVVQADTDSLDRFRRAYAC